MPLGPDPVRTPAGRRLPGDAVVRVLAEAEGVEEAGRDVLQALGEALRFRAGVLWIADEDDLLRCAACWSADDDSPWVRASARLALAAGEALPGAVWASGEPRWCADLDATAPAARCQAASEAGVRTVALAPVATASGRGLGVVELAGDGPREDGGELTALAVAGRQLGEFVRRIRAEEGLRSLEELQGAIVNAALDCVVVADHEGRVVDFNPAAEATFGVSREEAIGQLVGDLIVPPDVRRHHHDAFGDYVRRREPSRILDRRLELEAVRSDGTIFPVELTVTRLGTIEPPRFAGFIRDITDRRAAEAELNRLFEREHEARLRAENAERATRRIADALQRSLLPPHLPVIDGVELAATYRAGSDHAEVGGDFYDVFALAPDRWGVVVGDVRGKGPEAAAITALARYTVRTAAVRERSPEAVLRVLNDALLRDTETEAFCTVVYGTLDLSGADASLCLAVAGHPPPLVLHPGGSVDAPARRGALLGVLEDPPLHEVELRLAAGDLLLLYTDGLIEARTEDGRFGVEGLCSVLAGLGHADAATVVARVEDAAAAGGALDDDVAVLAVRAAGGPSTVEHDAEAPREAGGSEHVAVSLPAVPESVPGVRRAVVRLAQRAMDAAGCHRVATAVTEAAANVVVHAYRDGPTGTIDLTARLDPDELVVVVEDGGSGVRARDDSPGLGLGLPLIQHCADEVVVEQRADGGGSVRMLFRAASAT